MAGRDQRRLQPLGLGDFLADLPGTPKWIVVDGEAPVRLGIKLRLGDGPDAPVVFSCEGHLQRKVRDAR